MSAQSAHHGTSHFKQHSLAGWGVVIGTPFAVWSALSAIQSGPAGIFNWISGFSGAIGLSLFLSAVILYCKLELDEVIMDYISGRMRQFGLLANKVAAAMIWLANVGSLLIMAFLQA